MHAKRLPPLMLHTWFPVAKSRIGINEPWCNLWIKKQCWSLTLNKKVSYRIFGGIYSCCFAFTCPLLKGSEIYFGDHRCWVLLRMLIQCFDCSFLKSLAVEGSCLWVYITLINLTKLLCVFHKRCLNIHRNLKNCFHSLSFRNLGMKEYQS